MFKVILIIFFIFNFNQILTCEKQSRREIYPIVDFYKSDSSFLEELNYVPFTSTVKFSCHSYYTAYSFNERNNIKKQEDVESELLLHGNDAWNFPEQNIEFTIEYPNEDDNKSKLNTSGNQNQSSLNVTLARFDVILYLKGQNCQGFVNSGGVLQQSISLSFQCTNVTSMAYQFWLFGMDSSSTSKKSKGDSTETDYSYSC